MTQFFRKLKFICILNWFSVNLREQKNHRKITFVPVNKQLWKSANLNWFFTGSRGTQSPIAETFFWLLAVCCGLWIYKGRWLLVASRLVWWCQRNCSQSSETDFYEWWKVISGYIFMIYEDIIWNYFFRPNVL